MGLITNIFYFMSTMCVKVSVLLFYRRLLNPFHNKWLLNALWAAIVFVVLSSLIFCFVVLAACNPVDALWKQWNPGYTSDFHCKNWSVIGPLSSAFSVLSDLVTVLFPLTFIKDLRMPMLQKLGVYSVFAVGIL
jgi:hypothetical protein